VEARSPDCLSNVENAGNAIRAPIANPPNSAQLVGSLYHAPKLHLGPCSSVGVRPRTDRHTDARNHYTFCVVYDSRKM